MKKTLLTLAAAAAVACTANAQGLYAVGGFQGWDIANPTAFEATEVGYTITINDLTSLKLSTANDGTWEGFNAGGLDPTAAFDDNNQTRALVAGDADIMMPWQGDWTIFVTADYTEMTISTTTPAPTGPAEIYVRGGMNGWGAEANWMMQSEDGIIYTLSNVEIPEGTEFKIADANWGNINYGLVGGSAILLGESTELIFNAQNIVIDYEGETPAPLKLTFNLEDHTLLIDFDGESAINSVDADNAPAVYYNIQGVRVDNPQNGLFIRQQGSKTVKVVR